MVGIIDNLLTGGLFDFAGKLLDRFIPDPTARQAAQLQLTQMQMQGALAELTADTDLAKAQIGVNTVEAASPSLFIAGWRPFIGWVCGVQLAGDFAVKVFIALWQLLHGQTPTLDISTGEGILMALLGTPTIIGRTFEKKWKAQDVEPDH